MTAPDRGATYQIALASTGSSTHDAWYLRWRSARGDEPSSGSPPDPRRSGARVRLSSIISSAADLLWDWPCEMSEGRVERRLAAILAVDVAGYSRLMGADEEGTLAALRAVRRELSDPKIAEHRGRIVKTTGDGLLAEFASVVDAVRCAVEVQREMIARNAATPAERGIEFRMGINVGDIIIEDGDIFGDGVNIAAQLEALAEPGGICLSAAAHEQVRDRLDIAFEDLGEQQVKNIARPVRTYRVALGGSSVRRCRSALRCRSLTNRRSWSCRFRT